MLNDQIVLEIRKIDTKVQKAINETDSTNSNQLESKAERKKELLDMMSEIDEKVKGLKSYVLIAKTVYSCDDIVNDEALYDKKKLAQIALRLTTESDGKRLFFEAKSQENFLLATKHQLQSEYQSIEEKKEKELRKLMDAKKDDFIKMYNSIKSEELTKISHINEKFERQNSIDLDIVADSDSSEIGIGRIQYELANLSYIGSVINHGSRDGIKILSRIDIPVVITPEKESILYLEYTNKSEPVAWNGIQSILLNFLRLNKYRINSISLFDQIRYNNSAYGIFQNLIESENTIFNEVPKSEDEAKILLNKILEHSSLNERKRRQNEESRNEREVLVFLNYPYSFNREQQNIIQQMIVNAEQYGLFLILANNLSLQNKMSEMSFINDQCGVTEIKWENESHIYCENGKTHHFLWNELKTDKIPQNLIERIIVKEITIDNDYFTIVGSNTPHYQKGIRRICDIPIGIDEDGNVVSIDFEDNYFATYICGRSRSGKSVLLHTIITGIMKNSHPDDVELWLVDFKMMEFSHYISPLPPHVKYVVLDESPELVYDLLDNLTLIMKKRQSLFKGRWLKLDEVPKNQYMPEIVVIIDEFAEMSQIIFDSQTSSSENYVEKMQMLLAKGAALGIHFIFSSQGFTAGTKGLNEFSKNQIQQRISLKADFSEVKETLELVSMNDMDRELMETIQPRYALLKRNSKNGAHIVKSLVLFTDERERKEYVKSISDSLKKVDVYNTDNTCYKDKKPVVIDGNIYKTFSEYRETIEKYLNTENVNSYDDEINLFLGEPLRMKVLSPITLYNEFGENVFLYAPKSERETAVSVILSIMKSAIMQNIQVEVWTSRRNGIWEQFRKQKGLNVKVFQNLDEICENVIQIKEKIDSRKEGQKIVFFMGLDSIISDLSLVEQSSPSVRENDISSSSFSVSAREEGEPDLLTLLKEASENPEAFWADESKREEKEEKEENDIIFEEKVSSLYNAGNDIRYLINQGPRYGYHFALCYTSISSYMQLKVSESVKHKVLFRLSKEEAHNIVNASEAGVVSNLGDYLFRYTDGLDSMTFRPYFHEGLSWDNLIMQNGEIIDLIDEE